MVKRFFRKLLDKFLNLLLLCILHFALVENLCISRRTDLTGRECVCSSEGNAICTVRKNAHFCQSLAGSELNAANIYTLPIISNTVNITLFNLCALVGW